MRTMQAASAAAVTLLALAGCGGGSGSTETATPAPVAEEQAPQSAGDSVDAFVAYLRALVSADEAEPVGVEKFAAPKDDSSDD